MDSTEPPSKKRKRTSPGRGKGRIANGTDFWSQVDAWFEDLKEKYGSDDFTSPGWKRCVEPFLYTFNYSCSLSFIEESHQLDQQHYDVFSADGSGSSTMAFTASNPVIPNTQPVVSMSALPPLTPSFSRSAPSFALFDGLIQSQRIA
jgi:hypothetical protein